MWSLLKHLWLTIGCLGLVFTQASAADKLTRLKLVEEDGATRIKILAGDDVALSSPLEGLWSIATAWENGWPANWHHAHPQRVETFGEWTVLEGRIHLESGEWLVLDSYRSVGQVIECVRRFEWRGNTALDRVTLSARFQTPGTGKGVLVPGVLYHGNPSGARSGRTPIYSADPGELAVFEEHRLPMPFVSFEFPFGGSRLGAALHTQPSPVPYGSLQDQWWSVGLEANADFTELLVLSGPCASNGRKSVVKAIQRGFLPYDNAYMRVDPGAIIEKTFYLQGYSVEREGSGFQNAVKAAIDLFGPFSADGLPSFPEIITSKLRYARTRWYEQGEVSGFKKYIDRNPLVLGWCGQAAAPGYALQLLDPSPEANLMIQKSLDFLSSTKFYDQGFHTWYHPDSAKWEQPRGRPEMLSQGQAMQNFANAIRLGRSQGRDSAQWEDFLCKASDFHSSRILASNWKPLSTNEAFFIAPLAQAHSLFGEDRYRLAAIKAAEVYSSRHLSMSEPYWGGTLDASCEDKEGAWAALEGFLALYELTGKKQYLEWAQHAADVVLTYLVVWDIDLPPGRLRNHGFKTRGWTAVSVQNQHIDVYGVLIAPSIYRLGQLTERNDLVDLALLMFRSCGQLIDPLGSQGEQPQQTNYAQRGEVKSAFGLRGDYVEDWTVFWITAHFLNAAAQFKELGVRLD
ncbi:MAG TPA: hypothetical protein VMY18_14120 [Acidobacteriota bacterium]|nr:hypothetical protein [Acidobacteriota bacterium]